jgi:hypothetical protein
MDYPYIIINQCLQLLKLSDIPTIKKLRVEIQLIQMKRLLVNDSISNDPKREYGEDVFEVLLCQMRRISEGSCEGNDLVDLMNRIGGMLAVLGGDQASR